MNLYKIDLCTHNEPVYVVAQNLLSAVLMLGDDSNHIKSTELLSKNLIYNKSSIQPARKSQPPLQGDFLGDGLPDHSPDGVPVIGSDELVGMAAKGDGDLLDKLVEGDLKDDEL